MAMAFLYHLAGPPGSGKRTVGLHLARRTGAVLLDNHLFRDAVYRPYGADGVRPVPPELQALGAQVWALGLQAARLAPRDVSQIFTAYHTEGESGRASAERIRAVAVDRNAVYVPVWLECHEEELARRMTLPERRERAKMRDPQALREVLATSGTLAPPPGALRLDTAQLTPADTALLIASHAGALF
ncbi:AAA family ATPase [Deinococcus budaensis]|uniref:Uncharacterized protein n=1 Tax=Deinococcus budaensis TaxID=1665626 RepID=A0A7W8GGS3_9DEIO|nr:AAA family ATPase [Deinococcus budaensis]MBB5235337.1 hypothetical protein [Deinococcus budaensis]